MTVIVGAVVEIDHRSQHGIGVGNSVDPARDFLSLTIELTLELVHQYGGASLLDLAKRFVGARLNQPGNSRNAAANTQSDPQKQPAFKGHRTALLPPTAASPLPHPSAA